MTDWSPLDLVNFVVFFFTIIVLLEICSTTRKVDILQDCGFQFHLRTSEDTTTLCDAVVKKIVRVTQGTLYT